MNCSHVKKKTFLEVVGKAWGTSALPAEQWLATVRLVWGRGVGAS